MYCIPDRSPLWEAVSVCVRLRTNDILHPQVVCTHSSSGALELQGFREYVSHFWYYRLIPQSLRHTRTPSINCFQVKLFSGQVKYVGYCLSAKLNVPLSYRKSTEGLLLTAAGRLTAPGSLNSWDSALCNTEHDYCQGSADLESIWSSDWSANLLLRNIRKLPFFYYYINLSMTKIVDSKALL